MDISTLSISLPVAVSVVGCFIGIMTYLGNKKRQNKQDTAEEVKAHEEREARLVSMEKDIQYIRIAVDGITEKLDKHDKEIVYLKEQCKKKGGHK